MIKDHPMLKGQVDDSHGCRHRVGLQTLNNLEGISSYGHEFLLNRSDTFIFIKTAKTVTAKWGLELLQSCQASWSEHDNTRDVWILTKFPVARQISSKSRQLKIWRKKIKLLLQPARGL